MKKILFYTFSMFALFSCSSDDPSPMEISEPEFTFDVTGAINRTLSGKGIIYHETTTPVKNYKGEDTQITSILIIAQDQGDQVSFGVTLEESQVGAGNYEVGTDIFSFYNAFMNFADNISDTTTTTYKSKSGSINISSRGQITSGSVNVTCVGSGGDVTITGEFHAVNVD